MASVILQDENVNPQLYSTPNAMPGKQHKVLGTVFTPPTKKHRVAFADLQSADSPDSEIIVQSRRKRRQRDNNDNDEMKRSVRSRRTAVPLDPNDEGDGGVTPLRPILKTRARPPLIPKANNLDVPSTPTQVPTTPRVIASTSVPKSSARKRPQRIFKSGLGGAMRATRSDQEIDAETLEKEKEERLRQIEESERREKIAAMIREKEEVERQEAEKKRREEEERERRKREEEERQRREVEEKRIEDERLEKQRLAEEEKKQLERRKEEKKTRKPDWSFAGKNYYNSGRLGKGGSASVFAVYDDNRTNWALKVIGKEDLFPNADAEIQVMEKMSHCNHVIHIEAHAEVWNEKLNANMKLILMEMGHGTLLDDMNARRKTDAFPRDPHVHAMFVRTRMWLMLTALKEVHDTDIIHSDLKPANLVWVNNELKLIDFGITDIIEQPDYTVNVYPTKEDNFQCTPNYTCPEYLERREYGKGRDVWALGIILYEMIYGEKPYKQKHKDPHKQLRYIVETAAGVVDNLPSIELWDTEDATNAVDMLKKCLAYNPKERISVADMLNHPFLLEKPAWNCACAIERKLQEWESSGHKIDKTRLMMAQYFRLRFPNSLFNRM